MFRRHFLARLAAGAVPLALGRSGNAFAYTKKKHRVVSEPPRMERIAISTWSLRNYFQATRDSAFNLPGPMLTLLDFPDVIIDRFNVHHFEFCATHFPSTEQTYLHEVKYTLAHAQSTIVNIFVDIEECAPNGTFSSLDREERMAALETVKSWVDVAHELGVKSMCVGPGKVDPKNLARTADSYKAVAAYAQARGVRVTVENRGGFGSERPEDLVKLFKLTGTGRIGMLPDFSNFPDKRTRQKGLKLLFPYAETVCHAKALMFDPQGDEKTYDFPQAMAIAKSSGFHGVFSIEFEGPGDPYAGIQKTLDELLKYI